MNLLNPALTARAFAFFAYPTWMSGDQVWINTSGSDLLTVTQVQQRWVIWPLQ